MEMKIRIGRRPKSLHEGHGAALRLVDAVVARQPAVEAE
jgi:hypothetical protein